MVQYGCRRLEMLKTILKKIQKIKEELKRLEKIIQELEKSKLMPEQLYQFKMEYFEKSIILNYLERWDEM